MTNEPKIAIIGAGLAGLTAALRLNQKNYQIEVYEARKRVGGRILTALIKNANNNYSIIELGGQNIADGGKAHNILNLVSNLDLRITNDLLKVSSLISFEGKYYDFNQLLLQLNFPRDKIDEIVDIAAKNCVSLLEVINKIFPDNELAKMVFSTRLKAYEGLDVSKQSIYHNLDTFKCMLKGGISMAHQAFDDHRFLMQKVAGGNAKLPLKIAQILDQKIHLEKSLVRVSKKNQQIELLFADNSQAICDKLILAIPASTYCKIKFDDDIIPRNQLLKIQSLQYGNMYKILVPAKYGATDYSILTTNKGILFFDHDQAMMAMYLNEELTDFDQEITIINNDNLGIKIPATTLIKATDGQMMKYDNAVTHSWFLDAYAKGSYHGYDTILANQLDQHINYQGVTIKEIFQPVKDQIFFIGEHTTILDEIGTMEAAVESAERIAKIF
jgi:monoamine oxidase